MKERFFACLAVAKEPERNSFSKGNCFSGRTGEQVEREGDRFLVSPAYFCAEMCSPSLFLYV